MQNDYDYDYNYTPVSWYDYVYDYAPVIRYDDDYDYTLVIRYDYNYNYNYSLLRAIAAFLLNVTCRSCHVICMCLSVCWHSNPLQW